MLDTFQKCAIDALMKIGMNLLVLWQIPEKKKKNTHANTG